MRTWSLTILLCLTSLTRALGQPINDDCANAIAVGDGPFNGDNIGATTDGTSTCGGVLDVWWRYTAPLTGRARISVSTGLFDGVVLSVFDACGGVQLVCRGASFCEDTQVSFNVGQGISYLVRVASITSFDESFINGSISSRLFEPPSFLRQPVGLTRCPGTNAVFSVLVTGVPGGSGISFQWTKDGQAISGATFSSYFIFQVAPSDGGDYACIVSNIAGQVVSAVATLTVPNDCAPAPEFVLADVLNVGSNPIAIAAAQLNADQYSDLAVADFLDGTVTILLTNGPGTFDAPVPFAVGSGPVSVDVGRLRITEPIASASPDGLVDVVVAGGAGITYLQNQTSSGSFLVLAQSGIPPDQEGVTVADVNNLGVVDVVTLGLASGGAFEIHSRLGDGSSSGSNQCGVPFGHQPFGPLVPITGESASPATGWIFQQGQQDLVLVKPQAGVVHAFENLGEDPNFPEFLGWSATPSIHPVGQTPVSVAVADLDGDGWGDAAVANRDDDTLSILINQAVPGAGLGPATTIPLAPDADGPRSIIAVDLDGDGDMDLVVANELSDNISILINDGTGSFPSITHVDLPPGSRPADVTAGDFNGDGQIDLAVANFGTNNVAVLMAGRGSGGADDCNLAPPISDGLINFSTLGATTDGPAHPECQFDGQTYHDIWWQYTATCNGDLTLSTCNAADYDTDLVVYDGCDCANLVLLGCNDDAPGCAGFTSEVTVPVQSGMCYLIRVGGWNDGDMGTGTLSINCTPVDPLGSCCVGAGCIVETEANCLAQGGQYGGDFTDCLPLGACCTGPGACVATTDVCCTSAGGSFLGVGSNCGIGVFVAGPSLGIAVPDDGYNGLLASMAAVPVNVPAQPNPVSTVSVQLNMSHTWIGDLVIKLQSPSGTLVNLVSRAGFVEPADDGTGCCGDDSNLGAAFPVLFDDTRATSSEDMGADAADGDVIGIGTQFVGGFSSSGFMTAFSLSDFAGEDPTGTWTLYVGDAAGADLGTIDGWTLSLVGAGATPCSGGGTCATCPGDVSGDGVTDGSDIDGSVGCMLDPANGPGITPTSGCECIDVDGLLGVTPDDIADFVNILLTGGPCP